MHEQTDDLDAALERVIGELLASRARGHPQREAPRPRTTAGTGYVRADRDGQSDTGGARRPSGLSREAPAQLAGLDLADGAVRATSRSQPRRNRPPHLRDLPQAWDRHRRNRARGRPRFVPTPARPTRLLASAPIWHPTRSSRRHKVPERARCTPDTGSSPSRRTSRAASSRPDSSWIGPPPPALGLAGDKLTALDIAARSGVPTLASGEAGELGYPLIVKASAGGGGRGMRVVEEASELGRRRRGGAPRGHGRVRRRVGSTSSAL